MSNELYILGDKPTNPKNFDKQQFFTLILTLTSSTHTCPQEQYAFIHDAVLEGISCGETQIPASSFKRALTKLADKNNEKDVTGFEKQFEVDSK